jgi:hypothetical protein
LINPVAVPLAAYTGATDIEKNCNCHRCISESFLEEKLVLMHNELFLMLGQYFVDMRKVPG